MRAHLDIHHSGTVTDEGRVKMQIDSDSTSFLMSILTDLYSDPELAVIREYSTNALDSHRAAGNPAPIEVELPTLLRPTLVVRDQGLGLSVDEIVNNFSKYGWSSKRDTDAEVGMLGLGCKSGLTYTSQFTLVAVKNGIQATVLVTRDTDGAGAVQVMDTVSTDAPNGVEVRIPVHSSSSINRKAQDFFSYWEPGTVLINGAPAKSIFDDERSIVIDPDVVLVHGADDHLIMGNVAYPTGGTMRSIHYGVIARVAIGAVDFTPSREALHMTKRTKEVLADLQAYLSDSMKRTALKQVAEAPSAYEALQTAHKWRSGDLVSKNLDLVWKGRSVPHIPLEVKDGLAMEWDSGYRNASAGSKRVKAITLSHAQRSVFVLGHHGRSVPQPDKLRMQAWAKANKPDKTHVTFICTPELPGGDWLAGHVETITVEDLREIEIEMPQRRVAMSRDGLFRVVNGYGDIDKVKELKETIVWIPADLKSSFRMFMNILDIPKVSVVPVPNRSLNKFLTEYPEAISHADMIKALAWCWYANLTELDRAKIAMGHLVSQSGLRAFWEQRDRIIDPYLADLVNRFGNNYTPGRDVINVYSILLEACRHSSVDAVLPRVEVDPKVSRALQLLPRDYPMLRWGYDSRTISELVNYINHRYLANV